MLQLCVWVIYDHIVFLITKPLSDMQTNVNTSVYQDTFDHSVGRFVMKCCEQLVFLNNVKIIYECINYSFFIFSDDYMTVTV